MQIARPSPEKEQVTRENSCKNTKNTEGKKGEILYKFFHHGSRSGCQETEGQETEKDDGRDLQKGEFHFFKCKYIYSVPSAHLLLNNKQTRCSQGCSTITFVFN